MAANGRLQVGEQAPDFVLPATTGKMVHLYEVLETSSVVLFFYLKAFTPVCTAEVCRFQEKIMQFQDYGGAIYGVSSDSIANAERFAKQNRISFPLLSDANGEIRAQYQVPKVFGLLPGRSTYVIGQDKKIKKIIDSQLGAHTHVQESLQCFGANLP